MKQKIAVTGKESEECRLTLPTELEQNILLQVGPAIRGMSAKKDSVERERLSWGSVRGYPLALQLFRPETQRRSTPKAR
jgi:hypothetical protein